MGTERGVREEDEDLPGGQEAPPVEGLISYRVAPEAERDVLEILGFVAADDLAAADRLRDEIVETLRRLARFPEIGRRRPELSVRPGLRFWVVGAYIVVYDSRPRPIEVVRILHGARNLPSILE